MVAKIKTPNRHLKPSYKHKPRGVSNQAFARVHWPYLPFLLIAIILLAVSSQSGVLKAAVKNPTGDVLSYATSMSVGGLLSATNSSRASNSVANLQLNNSLIAAAQAKANDMASRNYWSHNTPEGSPPWIFVTNQGYTYQKLGENLAAGFADEQSAVNGWMASPSHRANMLDSAFTEVGFGYANNANYTSAGGGPMTVVVAFYGRPTVAAAAAPTAPPPPPAAKKTPAPQPVAAPPPAPQPSPAPAPAPPPQSAQPAAAPPAPKRAASTDIPPEATGLTIKTSRAQLAFAQVPAAHLATGLVTFLMLAAAGLWVTRHALALKRTLVMSEAFIVKHPLFDVILVVIGGLAYLLTKTAGFIQ